MTDIAEFHAGIRAFGAAYDYDSSYLNDLLDASAGAYEAFADAQKMGLHRWALPLDAHYVARIATMLSDDCGACGNLNVKMALEAGVDRGVVDGVLHAPETLKAHLRDVFEHTRDVISGADMNEDRIHRLRAHYGKEAFAELAVTITGSRIYPTIKRALGAMTACEIVSLPG